MKIDLAPMLFLSSMTGACAGEKKGGYPLEVPGLTAVFHLETSATLTNPSCKPIQYAGVISAWTSKVSDTGTTDYAPTPEWVEGKVPDKADVTFSLELPSDGSQEWNSVYVAAGFSSDACGTFDEGTEFRPSDLGIPDTYETHEVSAYLERICVYTTFMGTDGNKYSADCETIETDWSPVVMTDTAPDTSSASERETDQTQRKDL